MQFAEHLKKRFLPHCYIEVSTNGNGAHIFLVIDKTRWTDLDYNLALKELDAWLKGVLAETGIELDTVEIKGHCAVVTWKDGTPTHKAGILAKLPRDWERFAELRASPIYTTHELLALIRVNPIRKEETPKVQKMRQAGSVPCTGIDPKRLEGWMKIAKCMLPTPVRIGEDADNRLVVTHEDVGIFCVILEFVGKHPNEDGTLPWARTKALWDTLFEREVVPRRFNTRRFAWIRRMMNGAGLTDMQDPTYIVGERAAKWAPSPKFWELSSSLDKEGEEEQHLAETGFPIDAEQCWEKGTPLILGGIHAMARAERRCLEELVEAIILPPTWTLAL
jgi:hypothetical protein